MNIKKQLIKAAKEGHPVRIYREGFEDGWATGYVVATGPEYFALELISDSVHLNGYNCMRYADVSDINIPDPRWEFLEKALKLRGQKTMGDRDMDLSTLESILCEASKLFPVVTIHLENSDPDICYIGKVIGIDANQLQLKCITPDGVWEDETERYDLADITRVDFGGAYEDALALVAKSAHDNGRGDEGPPTRDKP